jgi:hypothetical protein
VQLKDKWRNLVKFRHLSQEDAQALQPKTSGPWYRRHLAAATASGSDGWVHACARVRARVCTATLACVAFIGGERELMLWGWWTSTECKWYAFGRCELPS